MHPLTNAGWRRPGIARRVAGYHDCVARPERLRVVTLIDTLLTGGAERMAVTIASRLDRERFESTVCVSRAFRASDETRHGPLAGELEEADVPVLRLNRGHRGE